MPSHFLTRSSFCHISYCEQIQSQHSEAILTLQKILATALSILTLTGAGKSYSPIDGSTFCFSRFDAAHLTSLIEKLPPLLLDLAQLCDPLEEEAYELHNFIHSLIEAILFEEEQLNLDLVSEDLLCFVKSLTPFFKEYANEQQLTHSLVKVEQRLSELLPAELVQMLLCNGKESVESTP